MDSADLCYVGCPSCPCPDVRSFFTKNICQSDSGIKTLLDSKYVFELENSDTRQNQTCVYQARVSIYGDGQLLIPINNSDSSDDLDLCIGSSDEGFTDVFQIEFPGEIELMSEISEFKNYAFDGYYEKIQVTINIFRNTSNTPDSSECDDYTPAEKENCSADEDEDSESDYGSTDPCACTYQIESDEIIYEHESDYYTETCKLPRCYPCGHDVTATALVDRDYIPSSSISDVNSNEDKKLRSYFLPSVFPFYANYNVEYSVNGTKYSKSIDISAATEFRPKTENTNVYETTMYSSEMGISVSETDEVEVEIHKGKSDCDCDCIFGWKDLTGTKAQKNYVPENTNNEKLVNSELNYYNCLCALGNCKLPNEEKKLKPVSWFRFSLNLGNLLKNKYGHNCKYTIDVSLKLGSSEEYAESFVMDLSKLVKNADASERINIKDYTIEKTVKLNTENISASNAVFKVCAVSGTSTTDDGYTTTPKKSDFECGCCQEYDYNYFNEYIETNPKKCIPCSKSDVVDGEKFLANEYEQFYYNAEMSGTFLMYANFSINGKNYRKLVGNGTGETYEHNVFIDDIPSEILTSAETLKVLHDS